MVVPRRRLRAPKANFSKMLSPAGLLYMGGAATCFYISYQFSKRIGMPNERVARRQAYVEKQKAVWKQRREAREKAAAEAPATVSERKN